MAKNKDRPRCGHYIFAHVALRQFAFGNPYLCLGAIGSKEGQHFLTDLLASVGEYCHGEKEEMSLTAEQLRIHNLRVNKCPCLVIEMPEPHSATEVYFVGIVLKPSPGDSAADLTGVEIRYFTLEKSYVTDEPAGTLLCEWTQDNEHLNYGKGPAPVLKKFLQAVTSKCE